jgi:very-short-patch-repair endonuclease
LACLEAKVVVEADGESHLQRIREDGERTKYLESAGWVVLRFWNTTIYDDLEAVKEAIYQTCTKRTSPTPLSPGTPGERGRG